MKTSNVACFLRTGALLLASLAAGRAGENPAPVPASAAPGAPVVQTAPALLPVRTLLYTWRDAKRNRDMPVKIYCPAGTGGPFPVVIVSHGLGGSRDGYEFLGRGWASHGYVSVHLQHHGSDRDIWGGGAAVLPAMRKSMADPMNAVARVLDVSFALDELTRLNRDGPDLKGRLDLAKVGVAGHSFGASTTLMAVGQKSPQPALSGLSLRDPRIRAAVAMSAPVTTSDPRALDRAYGDIAVPCLHMTGTRDDSPVGETPVERRRLPFDHMKCADQFLVIFTGGDHMIFSGRRFAVERPADAHFHEQIEKVSRVFWDAYLKGDSAARQWLTGNGFATELGKDGTWERKVPPARVPPQ